MTEHFFAPLIPPTMLVEDSEGRLVPCYLYTDAAQRLARMSAEETHGQHPDEPNTDNRPATV
jgi:hypothetical protein